MECWQERIKNEYAELSERLRKLRKYNIKIEVQRATRANMAEVHHDYSETLSLRQQKIMEDYKRILELRAELHGIELI